MRVVIAEDMALLRQGLARLLTDAGFDVVGGAGDADELPQRERNPLDALTDREREILSLMAQGYSNDSICNQLFISRRTVESHVSSVFAKLGIVESPESSRRVLAVLAYLQG